MPSIEAVVAYGMLAALQGLLVLLPRPTSTTSATRQRSPSPAWALILPGSLLVGTFGVLAVPSGATALALLAVVATPVLAIAAVLLVARGRRTAWLTLLPLLGAGAAFLYGWPAGMATTALAALGCLALGALLVRVTPLPWLGVGIGSMAMIDVALLSAGVGQPAAASLNAALADSPLPDFHRAQIGPITKDYPDLVLAAVLGSALAGRPLQGPAAALVALLAAGNGVLFFLADVIPATTPIALAAVIVAVLHRAGFGVTRALPRPRLRLRRVALGV